MSRRMDIYVYNVLLNQSIKGDCEVGNITNNREKWARAMNWLIDHHYLHIVRENNISVWRPNEKGQKYLDAVKASVECS